MAGIPTVLITTDPESSGTMRPPRAICPAGFALGHSLGRANRPGLQTEVLRTALSRLEELHWPGRVEAIAFAGYAAAPAEG